MGLRNQSGYVPAFSESAVSEALHRIVDQLGAVSDAAISGSIQHSTRDSPPTHKNGAGRYRLGTALSNLEPPAVRGLSQPKEKNSC